MVSFSGGAQRKNNVPRGCAPGQCTPQLGVQDAADRSRFLDHVAQKLEICFPAGSIRRTNSHLNFKPRSLGFSEKKREMLRVQGYADRLPNKVLRSGVSVDHIFGSNSEIPVTDFTPDNDAITLATELGVLLKPQYHTKSGKRLPRSLCLEFVEASFFRGNYFGNVDGVSEDGSFQSIFSLWRPIRGDYLDYFEYGSGSRPIRCHKLNFNNAAVWLAIACNTAIPEDAEPAFPWRLQYQESGDLIYTQVGDDEPYYRPSLKLIMEQEQKRPVVPILSVVPSTINKTENKNKYQGVAKEIQFSDEEEEKRAFNAVRRGYSHFTVGGVWFESSKPCSGRGAVKIHRGGLDYQVVFSSPKVYCGGNRNGETCFDGNLDFGAPGTRRQTGCRGHFTLGFFGVVLTHKVELIQYDSKPISKKGRTLPSLTLGDFIQQKNMVVSHCFAPRKDNEDAPRKGKEFINYELTRVDQMIQQVDDSHKSYLYEHIYTVPGKFSGEYVTEPSLDEYDEDYRRIASCLGPENLNIQNRSSLVEIYLDRIEQIMPSVKETWYYEKRRCRVPPRLRQYIKNNLTTRSGSWDKILNKGEMPCILQKYAVSSWVAPKPPKFVKGVQHKKNCNLSSSLPIKQRLGCNCEARVTSRKFRPNV